MRTVKLLLIIAFVMSLVLVYGCGEKGDNEVVGEVKGDVEQKEPTEQREKDIHYVNCDKLNMRSDPTTEGEKVDLLVLSDVVDVLKKTPDKVNVGGIVDRWCKVRTDEGKEGWVFGAYISKERGRVEYSIREGFWVEDVGWKYSKLFNDLDNNIIYCEHYDEKGELCLSDGGSARTEYKWERGHVVEEREYDEHGNLIMVPDTPTTSYCIKKYIYDSKGENCIKIIRYDLEGNKEEFKINRFPE